eukprot:SAG31_NODE_3158_length_4610_cov_2.329417_4_plen_84_part_00
MVDAEFEGSEQSTGSSRLRMVLRGPSRRVLSIALAGGFVAAGSADGSVRVWATRTSAQNPVSLARQCVYLHRCYLRNSLHVLF